jgi:phosphotransferase system HPr-like phosphotransfer protein
MNTIQTQTALAAGSPNASEVVVTKTAAETKSISSPVSSGNDYYSATAANDAVVAKVIASSINQSFSSASYNNEVSLSPSAKITDKLVLEEATDTSAPNIDTVTANVVGFVGSALANLAKRGFDEDQLTFFRNEALTGVEVGIDQAKLELIGIANDTVFKTIDETKESILNGINKLSVEPLEYLNTTKINENAEAGTQRALAAILVQTANNEMANIDFETRAFNAVKIDANRSLFTTSSSNISFSVQGELKEESRNALANLINKADSLAHTFYRGNIESAYNESIKIGYDDAQISGLAKELDKAGKFHQMKAYGEIQNLDVDNNESGFIAPKAVAEYLNKYLDVMEASKKILGDEQDFNQVLNGIVNQMKDVQVPDLLQAINRFHAFNKRFS